MTTSHLKSAESVVSLDNDKSSVVNLINCSVPKNLKLIVQAQKKISSYLASKQNELVPYLCWFKSLRATEVTYNMLINELKPLLKQGFLDQGIMARHVFIVGHDLGKNRIVPNGSCYLFVQASHTEGHAKHVDNCIYNNGLHMTRANVVMLQNQLRYYTLMFESGYMHLMAQVAPGVLNQNIKQSVLNPKDPVCSDPILKSSPSDPEPKPSVIESNLFLQRSISTNKVANGLGFYKPLDTDRSGPTPNSIPDGRNLKKVAVEKTVPSIAGEATTSNAPMTKVDDAKLFDDAEEFVPITKENINRAIETVNSLSQQGQLCQAVVDKNLKQPVIDIPTIRARLQEVFGNVDLNNVIIKTDLTCMFNSLDEALVANPSPGGRLYLFRQNNTAEDPDELNYRAEQCQMLCGSMTPGAVIAGLKRGCCMMTRASLRERPHSDHSPLKPNLTNDRKTSSVREIPNGLHQEPKVTKTQPTELTQSGLEQATVVKKADKKTNKGPLLPKTDVEIKLSETKNETKEGRSEIKANMKSVSSVPKSQNCQKSLVFKASCLEALNTPEQKVKSKNDQPEQKKKPKNNQPEQKVKVQKDQSEPKAKVKKDLSQPKPDIKNQPPQIKKDKIITAVLEDQNMSNRARKRALFLAKMAEKNNPSNSTKSESSSVSSQHSPVSSSPPPTSPYPQNLGPLNGTSTTTNLIPKATAVAGNKDTSLAKCKQTGSNPPNVIKKVSKGPVDWTTIDWEQKIKIDGLKSDMVKTLLPSLLGHGNAVVKVENLPSELTLHAFNLMMGTSTIKTDQLVATVRPRSNRKPHPVMNVRIVMDPSSADFQRLISKNRLKTVMQTVLNIGRTDFKDLELFLKDNYSSLFKLDDSLQLPQCVVSYKKLKPNTTTSNSSNAPSVSGSDI